MEKITHRVQYPLENLQVSRYLASGDQPINPQDTCYDLYAVCNHIGTVSGGHYTCYVKVGESWVECDDEEANILQDINTVVSDQGYILFYRRNTKKNSTS